jgi:methyl coenzyme M reductase subunit C-like uncharacterized protein (methanogenesis marker protein 7)
MINEDLIQVVFSEEEMDNANDALQDLLEVVGPKAPDLSNEERQEYGSVAEQNKLKINKARTYMQQYPGLVPSFVAMDEFERDYQAREQIGTLLIKMEDLLRKLGDTKILLDYDNYQDVLAFYRSVRYHANENNSQAILVYNDLKQFFPAPPRKKKEAE